MVRDASSYEGKLYAVRFYGESSMFYYRKDLFASDPISLPLHPIWTRVQATAKKIFRNPHGNPEGRHVDGCHQGLLWASMCLASSLAIVVPILLGWSAQRQLIGGLTLGAVKG